MNPVSKIVRIACAAQFLGALALSPAAATSAQAHELTDIALVSGPGKTFLKVSFSGAPSEGEFPLYFQKSDVTKGILTISFLETETAFPLGRHALDSASPGLEEIQLRKMTSPSGKTFLGLELKLKVPPVGDVPVEPAPNGALKFTLGPGGKRKFNWSLSKSLKSREDYLAAKAEAPPRAEAKTLKVKAPEPIPDSMPVASPASADEASPALNAPAAAATPASDAPAARKGKHGGKAGAAMPTSGAPQASGNEPTSTVKSALEEGAALDAAHGSKDGLSSSKVFSIGEGTKPMILLKDSAALKDKAGPGGKTLKKIPLGEKVERLEGKSGWLRVTAGADTGYLSAGDAVYADEMTQAQEKSLRTKVEAKQAKLAAVAAKQAAEEAKHAAAEQKKAAKAAEKLAKAAAKDSIKAAKAAAQDSLKAAKAAEAKQKADQKLAEAGGAKTPAREQKGAEAQTRKDAKPAETASASNISSLAPKLAIADNPELADKLAKEKRAAEDEKMRVEPEENRVTYNSYGRRDPFIPVEQGSIDNGIDIDQMKVVGIIWQSSEPMAVLEHTKEANVSFTVKQGDPVHNGRVSRITREAVTFDISEYGISRSYSLKLVSSKEGAKK